MDRERVFPFCINLRYKQLVIYFSSLGAIVLTPLENYRVFQNDDPAVFYCYGSGSLLGWILNGTTYNVNHTQRGIVAAPSVLTGATVSSQLIIPSNPAINNNTQVICTTIDITVFSRLTSQPANLTIQGECCYVY